MTFKTLDECYEYAFSLLEKDGYFNDESSGLSTYLQHHSDKVISVMKEKGYDGSLCFEGKYYDGWGALYWLFDKNRISRDEALKLTTRWVNFNQGMENND